MMTAQEAQNPVDGESTGLFQVPRIVEPIILLLWMIELWDLVQGIAIGSRRVPSSPMLKGLSPPTL